MIVLLVGGAVWYFVAEDDDGLTIGSDDLTAEQLATALLEADDVDDGFVETYRGPFRDSVASAESSDECEAAYRTLRSLSPEVEAAFDHPSDAMGMTHSAGRVRGDDPSFGEILDGMDACDSGLTLTYTDGIQVVGGMESEAVSGLGEDAFAMTFRAESAEFSGTLEVHRITFARGGVYATVTVSNQILQDGPNRLQMTGSADRDLARRLAEAAEERIERGLE